MAADSNATHYFNFGNSNDVNLIVTSASASIREGAESDPVGTATGFSTNVNNELIEYIQPGQYSLLMTELRNLPVGFHNWMVASRADPSVNATSLFAAEDVFPGSKTKCPGPCVEDTDASNSVWCTALWEDEAVRSYTESLYTWLFQNEMKVYVGVSGDEASWQFDPSYLIGPFANGTDPGDNYLSAILEDLSRCEAGLDNSFSAVATAVYNKLENTNVDVFKFKPLMGAYNFESSSDASGRWLKDMALLSWAFFNNSFGLPSASPYNRLAGSQVIAGITRKTVAGGSLCKLNNKLLRQTKIFLPTEDMSLQLIVNKVNQNPPKNINGDVVETWFVAVNYAVQNGVRNIVYLVMCDPYSIIEYQTDPGEYFHGINGTAEEIENGAPLFDTLGYRIGVKTLFRATCSNAKQ